MKHCKKCNITKSYSEFGKKKETKDGYRYCCRQCASLMSREKISNDPEARAKRNLNQKKFREKERTPEEAEAFRLKNVDQCKRQYYKDVERSRAYAKTWREKNPEHKRYMNSLRKKHIKIQTPKWADLKKIKEIYLTCPSGMHVDHVIPLRGKLVCGLHVENNLRHMNGDENVQKNNKFNQDDFSIVF